MRTLRSTEHAAAEHAAEHAAAEYAAEHAYDDTTLLSAMPNFLTLGLSRFAKELTEDQREYAVTLALFNASTQPTPHGDQIKVAVDEGTHVAKLRNYITFAPQKKAKDGN